MKKLSNTEDELKQSVQSGFSACKTMTIYHPLFLGTERAFDLKGYQD